MLQSVPMGIYVPGPSPIHRIPAGIKLATLLVLIIVLTAAPRTWWHALLGLALVAAGYLLARIPLRTTAEQTLPVLPLLLFLGAFQWWTKGLDAAATMVIGLFASVAAATLLTLTTTIAELLDSLERALRPLERFGFPVATVSLAISLTIRLIPLQLATVNEVLDARKARGASFSIAAFGIPVLVRSIRRARAIGEALMARGVGDE